VLNHLALGIVVIASWISSGFFLMKALMSGNEDIMERLILSVPYRIISGILLYMLILLVYYLIVYSNNLKEKIRNESRLQTLVREAELNMLKSQINPHFLFNSLNSVSSLTLKDPASAREMIIKLSDYLRYSLRHSETEKTLLKDEVDNIRRYLEIEKIRFGKRLNFTLNMDDNAIDWPVPNMILQPLFENAIKHGVYESTEPVTIEMKAETSLDKLHIEIRNNFDSESPLRKGAGIGLKNIRDRLLLLYDKEDLLMYQKEDKVFIVKLLIPNYENSSVNN
jgi:two-component system, LytTR family, sensor kinase